MRDSHSAAYFCLHFMVHCLCAGPISGNGISKKFPHVSHICSLIASSSLYGIMMNMVVIFSDDLPCWVSQFAMQLLPLLIISGLTIIVLETWVMYTRVFHPISIKWMDGIINQQGRAGLIYWSEVGLGVAMGAVCTTLAYANDPSILDLTGGSEGCDMQYPGFLVLTTMFGIHSFFILLAYIRILILFAEYVREYRRRSMGKFPAEEKRGFLMDDNELFGDDVPMDDINNSNEGVSLEQQAKKKDPLHYPSTYTGGMIINLIASIGLSMIIGFVVCIPYLMSVHNPRFEELLYERTGIEKDFLALIFNSIPVFCMALPISLEFWIEAAIMWKRHNRAYAVLGCCFPTNEIERIQRTNKIGFLEATRSALSYQIHGVGRDGEGKGKNKTRNGSKYGPISLDESEVSRRDTDTESELDEDDMILYDLSELDKPAPAPKNKAKAKDEYIGGRFMLEGADIPLSSEVITVLDEDDSQYMEVFQDSWWTDGLNQNYLAYHISDMIMIAEASLGRSDKPEIEEILMGIIRESAKIISEYPPPQNHHQDQDAIMIEASRIRGLEDLILRALSKKLFVSDIHHEFMQVVMVSGVSQQGLKLFQDAVSHPVTCDVFVWFILVATKAMASPHEGHDYIDAKKYPHIMNALKHYHTKYLKKETK